MAFEAALKTDRLGHTGRAVPIPRSATVAEDSQLEGKISAMLFKLTICDPT